VRTDTGTIVRTTRPSTFSPRCVSSSRKPRVITASTTSLTVPPSAVRIVLTSESRLRAHAQRRCGPIGPFSDEPDAGWRRLRRLMPARMRSTAPRAARRGPRTAAQALRPTS
jgi:hypothetical protein